MVSYWFELIVDSSLPERVVVVVHSIQSSMYAPVTLGDSVGLAVGETVGLCA